MPLQPDDPLFVADGEPDQLHGADAGHQCCRAPTASSAPPTTSTRTSTTTSPFVDQNQTYTSHPSHQVFLRAYEFNAAGEPVATGKLIVNRDLGADGIFGTADDVVIGGMATWAVVKAQARDILGINLTDADVFNVPLLATDAYGNFLPGPNGFPQVVMTGRRRHRRHGRRRARRGQSGGAHQPRQRRAHRPRLPRRHRAHAPTRRRRRRLTPDADNVVIGGPQPRGHLRQRAARRPLHRRRRPRQREHRPDRRPPHLPLRAQPPGRPHQGSDPGHGRGRRRGLPQRVAAHAGRGGARRPVDPAYWNGERLFQAAKFGTEMQYQHLVFEEFARTIQPQIDVFIARRPELPDGDRPGDRRRVRPHGLSLRPLDADRDRSTAWTRTSPPARSA